MHRARYLGLFLAEARDHLATTARLARRGSSSESGERSGAAPPDPLPEMRRRVHSLKGMAATMGYATMVDLTHALEDRLGGESVTGALSRDVADVVHCLQRMLERLELGESAEDADAATLLERLRRDLSPPASDEAPVQTGVEAVSEGGCRKVEVMLEAGAPLPAVATALLLGRLAELGRVRYVDPPMVTLRRGRVGRRLAVVLDSPLDSGELRQRVAELDSVADVRITPHREPRAAEGASTTETSWVRVRADLLDALLESTLELTLEHGRLQASLAGTHQVACCQHLDRCDLLLRKLRGDLVELRLVPFDSVADRVSDETAQLAAELGKQVRIEITGREVRIDRSLLDALLDPLMHLVRNAIDHGIEPPEERRRAGKSPQGTLRLSLHRGNDRVRFTVSDDGRGLRADALRRAAIESGRLSAEEAARLSDEQALLLITLPGFTTAGQVTRFSGRGVGMNLVRHRVEALGGRLDVRARAGHGARLVISAPFALAVLRAMLVRCSGELYALPVASVESTVRRPETPLDDLPLYDLAERLGLPPRAGEPPPWALVVPAHRGRFALAVDEVLGQREIVVRPLDASLASLREYSGAALLEDGSVALVLDPPRLAAPAA